MAKKIAPKTCWEYWKCPDECKKDCPAFKREMGDRCWFVAGNFCPKIKTKTFIHCWECPWFLEMNQEV